MLFNKESFSFKKIIATTLLFSFCNLSISIAEPILEEDTLKGTATVENAPLRLNNGTVITDSNAKINLSLRDSDVKQVLRMFANKAGLNIIFHSSVNGKITLDLVEVDINDAFELVLDTCELTYYKDGATIVIASKTADTKMTFSKRNLTTLPVKYVMAQDIADFLNKNVYGKNMIGLSNKDIATVNAMNNELLIFGSESDVEAAKKVIEKFDVKPLTSTYSLSHTTPKEMASLICSTYLGSITGSSNAGAAPSAGADPFAGSSTGFASGEGGGSSSSMAEVKDIELGGGVVACTIENDSSGGELKAFSKFKTTLAYFPQLGTVSLYGGSKYLSDSIGQFIKEHDKKQRMAYLEMNVLELTEEGSKEMANRWGMTTPFGMFDFDGKNFTFGGYNINETTGNVTSDPSVSPQIFNDHRGWFKQVSPLTGTNIYYSLTALLQNGNARTITNPKLMVTNGQKVVLDMTQDYIESVDVEISESSFTSSPVKDVTYNIEEDLGLKIQIVPFISDSGYVSVNITPEFATVADTVYATDEFDAQYIAATLLQRRNLELKNVRIKDGETLVLAGLITENEKQETYKIPVLGDLPLIGFLFRSSTNKKEKTELVIMVTPHIIYDKEDLKVENI